jgi:hypothetical protein
LRKDLNKLKISMFKKFKMKIKMLKVEDVSEYLLKMIEEMKENDFEKVQISMYSKELANLFHPLALLKENGNYAIMDAISIQLHFVLQQMPSEIKPDINNKLHAELVKYAKNLEVIERNLKELEVGNLEIYKALSNLFLIVKKLYIIKDKITPQYRNPPLFPS